MPTTEARIFQKGVKARARRRRYLRRKVEEKRNRGRISPATIRKVGEALKNMKATMPKAKPYKPTFTERIGRFVRSFGS